MKKSIIITCALLFSLSSFAQDDETAEWKNNWYLSVGGGTQVLFSSDVNNLELKQRFTPAFSLSGGKWFSPFLGVRLQAGGYSMNGYSTSEGIYLGDPLTNGGIYGTNDPVRNEVTIRPDGSYRHYLRYVNAHADIRVSLLNIFAGIGYSKWDVIPSAGIGYLRTLEYKGTPATDNLTTHFSLTGKYSITREWDVNAELSAMALPGSFDGRITRNACEAGAAVTVGVTYNFGNRPSRMIPCNYYYPDSERKADYSANSADYNLILDRVSDIDTKVDELERKIGGEERKTEQIIVEKQVRREPFVLTSIRFALNKTQPLKGQDINFANIMKYVQDNPQAKVRLEGYGDKATGKSEINLRIAGERVEAVRRLLEENYDVDPQQIETEALGDTVQPYNNNSWNRVVVVVAID